MLLKPENTLFVRGTTPVLLLAGAPVHDVLPALSSPDGKVPLCDGWSVLPKLTLCVVDGPGEHGLMIPAIAAPVLEGTADNTSATVRGAEAMAAWGADARQAGGVVVLSLDALPEVLDWTHLLGSGVAHGGFVRLPD
ncbi:hypothetical protein [Streptomyces resistomycificus]|uniref:Uncharacterized protein n=1 Tax=Streptomyces resistomycificus TaxID=67356 RepID=A0A0L8KYZ6_9ACTN|nr:hypothetical protein [Streptomyces resistomycificus]KOG31064.1 hypothetical protein ADK37_32480 [Streptomyces resistomycificus]KUN97044.1 hypothetical protein AQJ84_17505 [Streptomyces resistomycificus]